MVSTVGRLQHQDLEGIVYPSLVRMSSKGSLQCHTLHEKKDILIGNHNALTHVVMALWNTADRHLLQATVGHKWE